MQVSIKEGRHFWLDLKGTTVPPQSGMLYVPTGDALMYVYAYLQPIWYLLTINTYARSPAPCISHRRSRITYHRCQMFLAPPYYIYAYVRYALLLS